MNLLDEMRGTVLKPFLPETDFLTAEEELQGRLSSAESELLRLESLVELVAEQARALKPFRVAFTGETINKEITVVATSTCNAVLIAMPLVFDGEVNEKISIIAGPLGKATAPVTGAPKVAA